MLEIFCVCNPAFPSKFACHGNTSTEWVIEVNAIANATVMSKLWWHTCPSSRCLKVRMQNIGTLHPIAIRSHTNWTMSHRFLPDLSVRCHAHLGWHLAWTVLWVIGASHVHLRAEHVLIKAHLAKVGTRCQPKFALAEWTEHFTGPLGKTEVRITVIKIDSGLRERTNLSTKVFPAHPVIPLIQDSLRWYQYFGILLCDFRSCIDGIRSFTPGCHGLFKFCKSWYSDISRNVTFMLNKFVSFLLLVHLLIEVLIGCLLYTSDAADE